VLIATQFCLAAGPYLRHPAEKESLSPWSRNVTCFTSQTRGVIGWSQFSEERRISRLGSQVVKINTDLLHSHFTPPAFERSIGGVELVGSRVAAHARTTIATVSKGRFMMSPLCRSCRPRRVVNPIACTTSLISTVDVSLFSRQEKMASSYQTMISWEPGRRNLFTEPRPLIQSTKTHLERLEHEADQLWHFKRVLRLIRKLRSAPEARSHPLFAARVTVGLRPLVKGFNQRQQANLMTGTHCPMTPFNPV
jgi:hypothetical protein